MLGKLAKIRVKKKKKKERKKKHHLSVVGKIYFKLYETVGWGGVGWVPSFSTTFTNVDSLYGFLYFLSGVGWGGGRGYPHFPPLLQM